MKKMNKKGFTLIELLAVIIILGVLMIIAIPSVTEYISNSRKSAYVNSAEAYMNSVSIKVNEGKDLQFFDTGTLYLVPVGHEASRSCVSNEKGGPSPYSDTWDYAYVGVTYTGKGYNYFFMSRDGAGESINFTRRSDLADINKDAIVTGSDAHDYGLKEIYTKGELTNVSYVECAEGDTGCTGTAIPEALKTALTDVVTNSEGASDKLTSFDYNSIQIVNSCIIK